MALLVFTTGEYSVANFKNDTVSDRSGGQNLLVLISGEVNLLLSVFKPRTDAWLRSSLAHSGI